MVKTQVKKPKLVENGLRSSDFRTDFWVNFKWSYLTHFWADSCDSFSGINLEESSTNFLFWSDAESVLKASENGWEHDIAEKFNTNHYGFEQAFHGLLKISKFLPLRDSKPWKICVLWTRILCPKLLSKFPTSLARLIEHARRSVDVSWHFCTFSLWIWFDH